MLKEGRANSDDDENICQEANFAFARAGYRINDDRTTGTLTFGLGSNSNSRMRARKDGRTRTRAADF